MKEKKSFAYLLISIVFIGFLWIGFFFVPTLIDLYALEEDSKQYEIIITSETSNQK